MIHPIQRIPQVVIEEVRVSKAILGCDNFIFWLYQGGDSPFKDADGNLNISKVLEVMNACACHGVTSLDLSPPLVEAFRRLQSETDEEITGIGALQEWICENFTINGVSLKKCCEEIKATICSKLPSKHLQYLTQSPFKSLFIPNNTAQPLTQSQIDSIKMKTDFFKSRLELYQKLNVKLVQFGGGTADWLAALGRIDLLDHLSKLISNRGFHSLLVCHWASMVLPIAEKELEVAGYIVPINKQGGLITLYDALNVIKNVEKPIIAMKPLAKGSLAYDLEGAFTFIFKKVKATAVMVGVSSETEANQTFSTIAKVLSK